MKILTALLLCFCCAGLNAGIYTWTDSNGTVHFSDNPHPGAEKIDMPDAQLPSKGEQPSQPENTAPTGTPPAAAAASDDERSYDTLAIAEPQNDATLRSNQGNVPVLIDINPELKGGDLLQLILDGKALGKPQATKVFALTGVNRGTHKLAVQVVDEDNNVLQTSSEVTFYMHHAIQGRPA